MSLLDPLRSHELSSASSEWVPRFLRRRIEEATLDLGVMTLVKVPQKALIRISGPLPLDNAIRTSAYSWIPALYLKSPLVNRQSSSCALQGSHFHVIWP